VTTRSQQLYERALKRLPGGVNSPVRAMRSIGREPIFIASGAGSRIRDVDGGEYIDYVCSWGPLILGHADPRVVDAVTRAARLGTSFGAPTPGEVELAEQIADRMSSIEMVRMTSSGTEATMSALRLARAVTGRSRVLKFAGAYHGHVDGLLADAGSGLATQSIPASPGVPEVAAAQTVIAPFNDFAKLWELTDDPDLAAIIAEPVPANMGLVPPADGFLELLREAADQSGALLIFDEVISGFRIARGAAYSGRAELMERIAPAGDVYQAGTLSGNPLAVAAGLATLAQLDWAAYDRLARITELLASGLRDVAATAGVAVQVRSLPGLMTVFFSPTSVNDFAGAQACDTEAYGAWCRELLTRGVYPPPSQFEAWFPSLAHSDGDIELTIEAAARAFQALERQAR